MKEGKKIYREINGKSFMFLPVSHMGSRHFYEEIDKVLKENPKSLVIKESKRENQEYLKNPQNKDKIETIFAKLVYEQRKKIEIIAKKIGVDLVRQSKHLNEFKYGNKVIEPDIDLKDFGNHLKNFFKKEDLKLSLKSEKNLADAINLRENFSDEEKSALLNMIKPYIDNSKDRSENSTVKEMQKPRSELLLKEILRQSNLDNIDDVVIVIYGKQHIDYVLNYLNPAKP